MLGRSAATVLVLLAGAGSVSAATMKIEVIGNVEEILGASDIFGPGLSVGDPFRMSFFYDTSIGSIWTPEIGPKRDYLTSGPHAFSGEDLPVGIVGSVEMNGKTVHTQGGYVGNVMIQAPKMGPYGTGEGVISYNTNDLVYDESLGLWYVEDLFVNIIDGFSDLFIPPFNFETEYSYDLSTTVPRDGMEGAGWYEFTTSADAAGTQNVKSYVVTLVASHVSATRIEDLAPVPLPATGFLLAGGLGLIAAKKRRKPQA